MPRRRRTPPPLEVSYVAKSTDGTPDQSLTLKNNTETSIQPTLQLTPHNMYGHPMAKVETRTVLGSHLGAIVVPAHGSVTDILHFSGPASHDVRYVSTSMADVIEVDQQPLEQDVRAVMVDLSKAGTENPDEFWGVGVANPNPFLVQVRIALVAFADPVRRDAPRQPADVVTLEGDISLASMSDDVIWLPEDVRGRFDHVASALVGPTLV